MKAILFDIDGTLVKVGGAGREALARGASQTFGVPLEEAQAAARLVDFRGRTDVDLFEELGSRLGRPVQGIEPRLSDAYLEALVTTLDECRLEIMPGVREVLDALELREDVIVGLLTGNIRPAARLKLGRFGLGHLVDRPGGFGEDGRRRSELAEAAVRRAQAAGCGSGQVMVVGDTEHDVAAARGAGARTVAVATGWTDPAVLEACGADLFLPDLTQPALFFKMVDDL